METIYHFFKEDKANAVLLVIACLLLCFLLYKVAGIKIRFNKKEPGTVFSWSPSVSTPRNYLVELLRCKVGFGNKGESIPVFGSFPKLGIGKRGAGGVDLNAFDIERGLPIPNSLDILWAAYTEKKFYQANIKFSEELQNRMLELFREGDYGVKEKQRFRYNNLVITLLPEGKIWLYLDGSHRYVRLDYTLQAEEVSVELSDYVDTRHKTMDDFCTGRLSDYPKAIENLSKNGIPKGLWDTYAERFPYDIQIEFGDICNILAYISIGDRLQDIERLVGALADIERLYKKDSTGMLSGEYIAPAVVASPQQAFYAEKESLPMEQAAGRISGEFVMCYPPGIPILAPGEMVTQEIVEYILYARDKGCSMQGMEDPKVEYLQVLKGGI